MMAGDLYQKLDHCKSFVTNLIKSRKEEVHGREVPVFLGLSGIQGAGKTTLVSKLRDIFSSEPYNLKTLAFSIDDLYLPHDDLSQVARTNSDNPLLQHRGLPGTHDIKLALTIFSALVHGDQISIPRYDKSAFNGHGDRMDTSSWIEVNKKDEQPIQLVIIEGWCIGFRPLSEEELESTWKGAVKQAGQRTYEGRLGYLKFDHVQKINTNLRKYDALTDQLDALIHIDAEDTKYVYRWRQEQECALRQSNGSAMTEEQVVAFVDNYYPAYELYLPALRRGIFSRDGKQLRIVLDEERRVKSVYHL